MHGKNPVFTLNARLIRARNKITQANWLECLSGRLLFFCFFFILNGFSLQAQAVEKSKESAAAESKTPVRKIVTNGFSYRIAPAPAWVVPAKVDEPINNVSAPMHYALIDDQVKVEATTSSLFRHVVRVVDESAGLSTATQIQAVYDPSYQSLIFHKLEIVRDGHHINKLNKKSVQLLQRETELEYRMYDGLVTASVVLDDVRVGDKIDYSYSVTGMNPVFHGKFIYSDLTATQLGPMDIYQFRLLMPESRPVNYKVGPEVKVLATTANGITETIFRRTNVPQLKLENNVNESAYLDEEINISEFSDWAEVAKWAASLFTLPAVTATEIKARADEIRKSASSPAEQLLAVLNFVQTDIRYFGMEIGANTHKPTSPQILLQQRFGDCKDKVFLLIALLRELDIKAEPVLIATRFQSTVDTVLPSPLAFDHVIAKVSLDDQVYWLDGTRDYQKGPLDERQSTSFGKGLVANVETTQLATLPSFIDEARIDVDEHIVITKIADDPIMQSRIVYSGELAEFLRNSLATLPQEKIENQFVSQYVKLYPKIQKNKPMRIEEVPGHNAIALIEEFTLPSFWKYPEQRGLSAEVAYWNTAIALDHPNESSRKLPYSIQLPGLYKHTIRFDFPEDVLKNPDSSQFKEINNIFEYQVKYEAGQRQMTLVSTLRFLKDTVSPAEWPGFMDKANKVRPRFSSAITIPPMRLATAEKLKTDVANLQKSIQNKEDGYRFTTENQVKAKLQELFLHAQLDDGRLNPALRAQALRKLGVQLDTLGKAPEASNYYQEAIRIAPDDATIYSDAAINAFIVGNYPLSIEYAKKSLALAPNEDSVYNTMAYANYYAKIYPAAKQNLVTLLDSSKERERSYPAMWLFLAAMRNGEDATSLVKQYLPRSSSPDWPYPILQMYTGAGSYDDALQIAKKDNTKLCELYFYTGEKYLVEGDKKKAREYFKKSIDTGVIEFNEYTMSQKSLDAIQN